MSFSRLFITVALMVSLFASAQDARPTIAKILVTSATSQAISDSLVKSNILAREGGKFSRKQLTEDIRRLYATRQFDDVEANTATAKNGQVTITFRITPKPHVENIEFQGNEKFSSKKLRKKLEQKVDSVLDEKLLAADLRTLYDYYQGKGYNEVVIEQNVERLEATHTVNIIYAITEHSRYKTRGLEFVGHSAFGTRAIAKKMRTDVSFWGRIFPMGYFDETEFQNDLDQVRALYREAGHLDFRIDQVERRYNTAKSKIYLTLHLSEGEAYTVTDVTYSGAALLGDAELAELTRMKVGATYRGDLEDRDVKAITARYNRDGYLESRVVPELSADRATNSVKINYRVVEGTPSKIRNINIAGNTVTKDEVIRRELLVSPGDKSDSTKIDGSRRRLMNLGYFENVDVIPTSTGDPEVKDLSVTVAEKATGRLMLSAGFSSADSLVGGVEVAQTNFDLFDPWGFRGDGQRFRARGMVGSERNDLVVSFTEPWWFDRRLRLDTDFWKRTVSSNRDYDQESLGTSARVTKKLDAPFWRVTTGFRLEEIEISDIDASFSAAFQNAENDSDLVSALILGFTRDSRDKSINPNNGSVFSVNGELQSQGIGSYTDSVKLTLAYDKYWPVLKSSILKVAGEIAVIDDVGGGDPIRVFDRLFAGGTNSIRGFDEREVGPVDPGNTEPVGGQSSLLASMELLTPIYEETVLWALFVDSGNVWTDSFDWNPGEINVGAGVGLRLRLPIGAINIDYGFPIVREQDHLDSGGQFHFNMGYNF